MGRSEMPKETKSRTFLSGVDLDLEGEDVQHPSRRGLMLRPMREASPSQLTS